MADETLYDRRGGTYGIAGAVDVLALEIAATLNFVGVPDQEHQEFMTIIESYRPQVVAAVA